MIFNLRTQLWLTVGMLVVNAVVVMSERGSKRPLPLIKSKGANHD